MSITTERLPLKALLRERGVTVSDLAAAIDYDREHVGRVVNGLRRPSDRLRQRIAEHLGAEPGEIFPSLTAASVVEHRIRELVDGAPALSTEQRAALAVLLLSPSAA